MHEKAKMPFSQHFPHGWWQQIGLLRVVLQKIGDPALLLSRQYRGSVKPSCHTDSYTPRGDRKYAQWTEATGDRGATWRIWFWRLDTGGWTMETRKAGPPPPPGFFL